MLLGDNLRRHRERKNMTQQEVANSIGLSRGYYVNIETNRKIPSLDVIEKLSQLFKVSKSALIASEDFVETLIEEKENLILDTLISKTENDAITWEYVENNNTVLSLVNENPMWVFLNCSISDVIYSSIGDKFYVVLPSKEYELQVYNQSKCIAYIYNGAYQDKLKYLYDMGTPIDINDIEVLDSILDDLK